MTSSDNFDAMASIPVNPGEGDNPTFPVGGPLPTAPSDATPESDATPVVDDAGGAVDSVEEKLVEQAATEASPEPVDDKKAKKPRSSSSAQGMSYDGKPVSLDELRDRAHVPQPEKGRYPRVSGLTKVPLPAQEAPHVDNFDLADLQHSFVAAMRAMEQVNAMQEVAMRELVMAETALRTAKALVLLGISGGTVQVKEAFVDLMVAEEVQEVEIKRVVVNELANRSRTLFKEVEALGQMSNNMRARMNIQ